jgi:hypothetical protein
MKSRAGIEASRGTRRQCVYYEDVKVPDKGTVSLIGMDYGYKASEWRKIWDDPKNADLVKKRGKPEHLREGDTVWVKIPWHTVTRNLRVDGKGAAFLVQRNGAPGKNLSWVQTVFRDNQPIGPNPAKFCVDGCTPDDNLPFYWTEDEVSSPPSWVKTFSGDPKVSLSQTFADMAHRGTPTAAQGDTHWRAIVSIAVVNGTRITVYDSWVWGFDLTTAGVATTVGPRAAKPNEIHGHLHLLREGLGGWIIDETLWGIHIRLELLNPVKFSAQGWTFRSPP